MQRNSGDHILHISTAAAWAEAQRAGAYRADSLATEGFIHCSTPAQVAVTANRLYRGRRDLILLRIDPRKVAPEIRYDPAANGELFPHIYGPLNLDAVVEIIPFPPGADGTFAW
jgi:uncharacterized protein (DUF952 family)